MTSGRCDPTAAGRGSSHERSLDEYPSWSPDGKRLVFQTTRNGGFDVYTMNRDGTSQRSLTRHPANDKWASWSPDGKYIAFVSDRSGSEDVFLIRPDGRGLRNVTGTPDLEESHPTWSPTGALTYLRHADVGPIDLVAADPDGGNPAVSTRLQNRSSCSTGPTADLRGQGTWTTSSLIPSGSWKTSRSSRGRTAIPAARSRSRGRGRGPTGSALRRARARRPRTRGGGARSSSGRALRETAPRGSQRDADTVTVEVPDRLAALAAELGRVRVAERLEQLR